MRRLRENFAKILTVFVFGGVYLSVAQPSQATTITFETLSDGVTSPTAGQSTANEYALLGVTFGTAALPVFASYVPLISPPAHPPMGNEWFVQTGFVGVGGLNILFTNPVFDVSGDVVVNPISSVTASAYDAANNLLATTVIPSGATTWIAGSFSFSTSTPVALVNLLPSHPQSGAGLDNLMFDGTPIPEPSTLFLLGSGLLGVLVIRRRHAGT